MSNQSAEVLNKILEFCQHNGEDPFEYQSEAAPAPQVFVSWCLGKGYISKEHFDNFLNEFDDNYEFFMLFGNDEESLISSEKYGYDYLAEFITSSDFYLERFNKNFAI
jgi:hypothetical protein